MVVLGPKIPVDFEGFSFASFFAKATKDRKATADKPFISRPALP